MKSFFISLCCAILVALPATAARKAQFQQTLPEGASVSGGTYTNGRIN